MITCIKLTKKCAQMSFSKKKLQLNLLQNLLKNSHSRAAAPEILLWIRKKIQKYNLFIAKNVTTMYFNFSKLWPLIFLVVSSTSTWSYSPSKVHTNSKWCVSFTNSLANKTCFLYFRMLSFLDCRQFNQWRRFPFENNVFYNNLKRILLSNQKVI